MCYITALLFFLNSEFQFVVGAPRHQVLDLVPVGPLVIVGNPGYYSGVIWEAQACSPRWRGSRGEASAYSPVGHLCSGTGLKRFGCLTSHTALQPVGQEVQSPDSEGCTDAKVIEFGNQLGRYDGV